MANLRWATLRSNDYYKCFSTLDGKLLGYVALIHGVWVACAPDISVRVEFPTEEEATQFLTVVVSGDAT